jgi:hypothetical protein
MYHIYLFLRRLGFSPHDSEAIKVLRRCLLHVAWPSRSPDLTAFGVHKGPGVPHTSHLFARFEKMHRPFCGKNQASNVWQRFPGI